MIKSRLEIYPSADIKDRAVIVGERTALKSLAKAILQAAENPTGFHTINLYKGNGHDYEILITQNITEIEWQNMPKEPSSIDFIKDYAEFKSTLSK